MSDKPKKQRSPNLQAGALANELVKLRARVQRHEAGLSEAKAELARLESESDPKVLTMARALLGAAAEPAKDGKARA